MRDVSSFGWVNIFLKCLFSIQMSNVQWLRKHKQEELVTMACFHQIFPDVIKDPVVADVNLVVKYLNSEVCFQFPQIRIPEPVG